MSKAALHNHLDTSYLDGRARPIEMATQALAADYDAVASTDHDEVGGQLLFQEACKKVGIKDIKGTEARWLIDIEASREAKTKGSDASHICLLAENDQGLSNMWALSSLAYEKEYFYQKPNLTPDLMRRYSSGLWASDGCGLTRFATHVEAGDEDMARQEWGTLLDIFGDHFYSELHTFQIIEPKTDKDLALNARIKGMNHAKIRFAQEMGVPLVIVNDAHYAQREQWEEHRLVWAMNTYKGDQTEKGQAADWLMDGNEIDYWMDRQGICGSVIAEAVKNSGWIAEQCNAEITPHLHMPRFKNTDAEDRAAFFAAIEEGYKRRISDRGLDEKLYLDRLEYESRLIVDEGMAGYFGVVADYVLRARDGSYKVYVEHTDPTPCICGPGRGSAGGSLVTYLLGITALDPIKYDLMFERFINPDRPDKPDIDVDVQRSHRLGVKGYVSKRYNDANVCSIGTRSRSGPKQSIRDIGKALGIPYTTITKIADLVGEIDRSEENDDEENPDAEVVTWDEVLQEKGGDLAEYARDHPDLFQYVEKMIGLARQSGVHAAGIVINTEPLLGNVPTRRKPGGSGTLATQFDMHEIEALGGVKLDLLSNKGLDVLAFARKLIYERHGVWIDYDGLGVGVPEGFSGEIITLGDEQLNDPAIWEQIHRGQTAGIFQIHTASGTKQVMRFKPRSLVDLADVVAVNRPAVLRVPGLLDTYLRRRNGEEPVAYDHPLLEPITGPSSSMNTHGILVYQEQLIRAAREIAGFDAGQAEALRKAIGKKLMDKMIAMEPMFIDGCMANEEFTSQGGTKPVAQKLWASLLASGAYAFNKSHATGYAMQACWEIWTKHYYFDEFIVGCLMVHEDKKRPRFIRECRQRGRPILGPDINRSGARFTLTDDGIRYGITDIKGVGDSVMPDIIKNRPYTDMTDYLARTRKGGGHKKGVIDSLVKIGAFDEISAFGREELLEEVYYHRCGQEVAPNKWAGLSYDERAEIVNTKQAERPEEFPRYTFDDKTILEIEQDLVGDFVLHDPMAKYATMIESECIRHPLDVDDYQTGERFTIGGQITRLRTHKQRDGREMCFMLVHWNGEDFDIMVFADAWKAHTGLLRVGDAVACDVLKLKRKGCQLSLAIRLEELFKEKT